MMAKLRKLWSDVNASYWFFPALFAVAALLLATLTIQLDRAGYAAWVNEVKWLQPARPDGASNMLTVIAGSMIGVASTLFSITIAAVAIVLTVPPVAVACEGSGQHPLGAERRLGGRGSVIDTRWFTVAVAVAVIPSVAAITVTVAVAVAAVVPLSVLLAPSLAPLLLLLLHALVE